MDIKKFAGIDCKEVLSTSNRVEYQEAHFYEKLKMKLHLLLCRDCKEFEQKNKKLTELMEKADLQRCSEAEKDTYRARMSSNGSDGL